MRPIKPPTVTPMMMAVPFELLVDEIEEGVEEGVDVTETEFPTVDSGGPTSRDALTRLNVSVVTTSRYAHAGTAVAELILFGYMDTKTIELGQPWCHSDHFVGGSASVIGVSTWQAPHALRRE